jgi:hypothetical protein
MRKLMQHIEEEKSRIVQMLFSSHRPPPFLLALKALLPTIMKFRSIFFYCFAFFAAAEKKGKILLINFSFPLRRK